jgi:ADP-ribosylation factor-like protein 2
MGLLSIIKKQKAKDREVRVLVLGLDNAGKSTVVAAMLGLPTNDVVSTMGFEIKTHRHRGYTLNFWDVGGQSTLRGFWGNYYDKTDVVVWVVDSLSAERLEELFSELESKVMQQDRLDGVRLAVLINKVDLYEGDGEELRRRVGDSLGLRESNGWGLFSVSGRTGKGLGEVMDWIVGERSDDTSDQRSERE